MYVYDFRGVDGGIGAGEFTRRAFEHGKLDLTQVEGLADMLSSNTEKQLNLALRQYQGVLGRVLQTWSTDLIKNLAWVEAIIDFAEGFFLSLSLSLSFSLSLSLSVCVYISGLLGLLGLLVLLGFIRVLPLIFKESITLILIYIYMYVCICMYEDESDVSEQKILVDVQQDLKRLITDMKTYLSDARRGIYTHIQTYIHTYIHTYIIPGLS